MAKMADRALAPAVLHPLQNGVANLGRVYWCDVMMVCWCDDTIHVCNYRIFITPPARRAWRSCKFAPFLFFFRLSMSKVGLPLMSDTAGFFLLFSALLHII